MINELRYELLLKAILELIALLNQKGILTSKDIEEFESSLKEEYLT